MEKKQKEKQTTHKSLKRESQIEAKSSLIKVCTAQLPSKTLKSPLSPPIPIIPIHHFPAGLGGLYPQRSLHLP